VTTPPAQKFTRDCACADPGALDHRHAIANLGMQASLIRRASIGHIAYHSLLFSGDPGFEGHVPGEAEQSGL
jgi:hypothetical protein